MFLYRLLLRLYSAEHQYDFGSEMLGVFREAAAEHRAQGRQAYLRFLAAEYAGLVKGSLNAGHLQLRLAPFCGGISFAVVANYLLYSAIFRLLTAVNRALHNTSLPATNPLTPSITISMFGVTVVLALLPLFILMRTRINLRRS